MNIRNFVTVITGGGSGIGRATAILCAEQGAHVVVCGRNPNALSETVSIIEKAGHKAVAIPIDVGNWSRVTEMVSAVLKQFGKLDILINNAGVAIGKTVADITVEEWDSILTTNLRGTFLCCKAVLPSMLANQKGIIVNVSSILGKAGIANMAAYSASKFGILGFTQSLAEELKTKRIRVYAVCPGPTYTTLHRNLVGEEKAITAMPPEKIAKEIFDLLTSRTFLPTGSDIVIDEPFTVGRVNRGRIHSLISRLRSSLISQRIKRVFKAK